jgi:1,4-alpha-glucan branching enzyme
MKTLFNILFQLTIILGWSQAVSLTPAIIEVDQPVTITVYVNSSDTDCNHFNNPSKVYMHAGIGDDNNAWGYSVVGNWGQDDGVGLMTNNGDGTWSITITPESYFGLTSQQASSATKIGMVFRNEDGSQEFKDNGCNDFIFNVGAFQVTMINPDESGVIVKEHGGSTQILAQNSGGNATYNLYANGQLIHTQTDTNFYNGYLFENLTQNQYCELVVSMNGSNITKSFMILVNNTQEEAMSGEWEDGINYQSDQTKAVLVLNAPLKDFVYVAGNFNDWKPNSDYAMKKDPVTGKFWLELNGLTPQENYTYQYWVADETPIQDSPILVKTADPFSTLVLSPFDDPWIPANNYPNLPAYPTGQEREVTLLKTGEESFVWNEGQYVRPQKEDLVIYEVLIRDFDAHRSFQDLIDRIDYFKNLHINAIELMPVMEFEGNEGWGYNPSFHLALDKFYGTKEKLKELVNLYHQNGIAVILDVALNHAMGRNPMVRMWMEDPDNDGWGAPSSENPYFNQEPRHAYNVGYDFNHSSSLTQYYTKRVIKHWIEEFHIDGFRWDLTKGFTQNCTASDENCTNSYQQDRVDILKSYADYSWSVDPDHYVIFEHLGSDAEEKQWADYKIGEGKGVMMWQKSTDPYNELTMGQNGFKDFSRMGYHEHGFAGKRVLGYAESHDEERLMFKNLQYGQNSNPGYNVRNLPVALSRMKTLGAVMFFIPGPKMIWHFGDLGMDLSINTCTDGTINPDCRLATKPQPQWENDWLNDPDRKQIYEAWAKMIQLKTTEEVFKGDYSIDAGGFTPKIYVWNDQLDVNQLKNVVILSNFDVISQQVTANFPYTGTWYNLMDGTEINVTDTAMQINLAPGEYKIFGNKMSTAVTPNYEFEVLKIFPNPVENVLNISGEYQQIEMYDLSGKLIKAWKNNAKQLFINEIPSGMYLLKIYNEKGIIHKKIIKN